MTFAENLIQLRIASQLEFIDLVTSLADNLSALAGFDEDSAYGINMAVRESVANAVEHGNRYDPNRAVEINFLLGETEFSIRVRDHGEGFDPSDLPDPLDQVHQPESREQQDRRDHDVTRQGVEIRAQFPAHQCHEDAHVSPPAPFRGSDG